MTDVTEVTSEQPAAAEGEAKPEEAEKKEEEPPKKPREEKKKEPKPKVEKPPPDYRTVKQGWIERPGMDRDFLLSLSLSCLLLFTLDCVYRDLLQELQAPLHDP